jgi:uncharacterized protein
MEMKDHRDIQADPATVFAALLDPEVLKAAVPGAQEVTGNPEDGYEAVVVQKVGPVRATFRGKVRMSEMVQGESLVIAGEGKGGAAGFAKGGAKVTLVPLEGGATRLSYEVEARVGGKLAQLGSRIIDGFAKKMADQFFVNLQAAIEDPPEADIVDEDGEAKKEDGEARKKGWLGRLTGRE